MRWFASNLSISAGVLGAEVIDLKNLIIRFGYTSDELRLIVSNMADCMSNSFPPEPIILH